MRNWERRLAQVHADEEGQLSILSLIVLLTLALSLCAVVNVVHAVRGKLETQNAADGLTQAAATQMARGMNAITAANHLIGEMHALTILFHALGGDDLENGNDDDRTPSVVKQSVKWSYEFARDATSTVPEFLRPQEDHYDEAFSKDIVVEAAIGKARLHLKMVAFYAYDAHFQAGVLYDIGEIVEKIIPPLGAAIKAYAMSIMAGCVVFETQGSAEWQVLDAMERMAKTLLLTPIKAVRNAVIPALNLYSQGARLAIPKRMEDVVEVTADYHGVAGSLFPGFAKPTWPLLQLPVSPEADEFADDALWRSQLVRAAVPWVHYWRLPLLEFGEDALWLSRFKAYYVEFTQSDTLLLTQRAKENGLQLLILKDLDITEQEKGDEEWSYADGSVRADELFAIVGLAHHPRRAIAAPRFFDSPNEKGWGAFAQAMIYNANLQSRGSASTEWQGEIGWDTLNFAETRVPEWKAGADPKPGQDTPVSYYRDRAPEPKIILNWRTLMVPSTRISSAATWQTGDLRNLLDRSHLELRAARTH